VKKKFLKLRTDHLIPDGVEIAVEWDQFVVGASVFIPAINTTRLITEMYEIARDKNFQLKHQILIDGGKWGVRFWRIL
jgi:hypothetical protein